MACLVLKDKIQKQQLASDECYEGLLFTQKSGPTI